MIPNVPLRYALLVGYTLVMSAFWVYRQRYNPIQYHTSIGKNGHLSWGWTKHKGYENVYLIAGVLLYIGGLWASNKAVFLWFGLPILLISVWKHWQYNTFGTMWCWYLNLFFLYCLVDLLLIKPYFEYNGLC